MVDPVKIMIGGKNHVLNKIEQKLLYCGNEYGKTLALKDLINVTSNEDFLKVYFISERRIRSASPHFPPI
jgi:superfamily II DNA/RNA helicase